MYVSIHHNITNTKKWGEGLTKLVQLIESDELPEGVKACHYLPSADGHRADCLWQCDSIDELKGFLESYTGGASKDEYFQVDQQSAMGLPHQTAAASH